MASGKNCPQGTTGVGDGSSGKCYSCPPQFGYYITLTDNPDFVYDSGAQAYVVCHSYGYNQGIYENKAAQPIITDAPEVAAEAGTLAGSTSKTTSNTWIWIIVAIIIIFVLYKKHKK